MVRITNAGMLRKKFAGAFEFRVDSRAADNLGSSYGTSVIGPSLPATGPSPPSGGAIWSPQRCPRHLRGHSTFALNKGARLRSLPTQLAQRTKRRSRREFCTTSNLLALKPFQIGAAGFDSIRGNSNFVKVICHLTCSRRLLCTDRWRSMNLTCRYRLGLLARSQARLSVFALPQRHARSSPINRRDPHPDLIHLLKTRLRPIMFRAALASGCTQPNAKRPPDFGHYFCESRLVILIRCHCLVAGGTTDWNLSLSLAFVIE